MTVEIIRLDDLADTIEEMLVGYAENITQGITVAGYEAAKECRKALKQTSPKQHGDYSKSWVISKQKGRPGEPMRYIVHNREHYRLTHLLKNGHLIKRDNKVIGRAPAQVHIAPVEEATKEKFVQDVEDVIREA